ncbi:MAG: SDH family Clp fold serine proteinase [Candidatus Helarchaeota archaeon]
MPDWGEILNELKEGMDKDKKQPPFDTIRRKYLCELYKYTGRNTILYASKWTQAESILLDAVNINEEDIQGFMTVIHGLKGSELDIILHTPGGSPSATEALVSYLRSKFDHIRVIIPYAAMSAGTMLACCADEIIMGKHSFIGPTDPQIIYQVGSTKRSIPAFAILDQFKMAKEECKKDPKNIGVWIPILQNYGPALLIECKNAIDLSKILVKKWLKKYMFKEENVNEAERISTEISDILSDHNRFKSHGRHIGIDKARKIGLKVKNLENDQTFQDLILSIFHATTHTFSATPAIKIIENHLGNAFIKNLKIILTQPEIPPITPPPKKQ